MRVFDQLPRQADRQEFLALKAIPVRIAHKADAQRVAIDCANQLFVLRQLRCGVLLHGDLRGLPHSLNAHAAAEPRDVDLADVFALADAEHRARVELFAPLRLRAEGVGRRTLVVLRVPAGVHSEDADARDQFNSIRSVVLPFRKQLFGLRLRVAPALLAPAAQDDGIGRAVAKVERYGIVEGRRHRDGHFKDRGHVAADFVQRVRAAGDRARALPVSKVVVPVVAAAHRRNARALRVRHRQLRRLDGRGLCAAARERKRHHRAEEKGNESFHGGVLAFCVVMIIDGRGGGKVPAWMEKAREGGGMPPSLPRRLTVLTT